MFGHVLRMPEETPAQKSLEFAVDGSNKYCGRRGRHCKILFGTLQADLREVKLGFTQKQEETEGAQGARRRQIKMDSVEEELLAVVGCFCYFNCRTQFMKMMMIQIIYDINNNY